MNITKKLKNTQKNMEEIENHLTTKRKQKRVWTKPFEKFH